MALSERGQGGNPGPDLPESNLPAACATSIEPEGSLYNGDLSGLKLVWSASEENAQTVMDLSLARRKLKLGAPHIVKDIRERGNLEGCSTSLGINALSTAYLWLSIPALSAVISATASSTDIQLAA